MFGHDPRLPIDAAFGLTCNDPDEVPLNRHMEALRSRLRESFELATAAANKARVKQKKHYDKRVRGAAVEVGDRVLVRIVAFDGKHKLSDKWEEAVYQVLDQPNLDIPVYVVQKEDRTGRKRTLHRNLLLPLGSIEEMPVLTKEHSDSKDHQRRQTRALRKSKQQHSEGEATDTEDSGEEEGVMLDGSKHSVAEAAQPTALEGNRAAAEERVAAEEETGTQEPLQEVEDLHNVGQNDESTSEQDETVPKTVAEDRNSEGEAQPSPISSPRPAGGPPVPAPRRSTRGWDRPQWMKSGDFVMLHQTKLPDWLSSVEYLMKETDTLKEMPDWMAKAVVNKILGQCNK